MNVLKTTSETVIDAIKENQSVTIDEIKLTSNLVDDLGFDSLSTVEIVMNLEEKFGITIPEEDANKLKTVQDVIDYIERKVKEKDAICA